MLSPKPKDCNHKAGLFITPVSALMVRLRTKGYHCPWKQQNKKSREPPCSLFLCLHIQPMNNADKLVHAAVDLPQAARKLADFILLGDHKLFD